MSSKINKKISFLFIGRVLILAILVTSVILTERFYDFMYGHGLIFVLVGAVAMAFMSFSIPEIGAAFKHAAGIPGVGEEIRKSALFWESASRNAWMLGGLGSLINFIITFSISASDSQGGASFFATRMAASFITMVYGMVLGVICFVPAWKLKEKLQKQPLEEALETPKKRGQRIITNFRIENVIGFILFIALVSWTIIRPVLSISTLRLYPWKWIIYWPSLLVVVGGTIALALFVGNSATGRAFTLGFSVTGLIGALMGFIQVLLSFVQRTILDVAASMSFILSSCFFALLGMMLIGAPLEDWMVKTGRTNKHSTLSRVAWYVFPLVALVFSLFTLMVLITPITKKG